MQENKVKAPIRFIFRPKSSILSNTTALYILVDYSNVLYRAWFVSREEQWIAICKFFDMLRLCVNKSKQPKIPIKIIFAGESKTRLKRKDIFEGYKGDRPPIKNQEFYIYRKNLNRLIQDLGWTILSIDGAEADDVIASIVNQKCHRCYCKVPCENCDCAQKYTEDVVIFSADNDLQQLLAWDRVLIYSSYNMFKTRETFEREYGIPVKKYDIYKMLIGDKSDSIAGVEGFGPVKAQRAINANSVAIDIWELGGQEASDQFKLARKLVKLDTTLDIFLDDLYVGPPIIPQDLSYLPKPKSIIFEINRLKEELSC